MRVARLLLPSHSHFDLKCFALDCAAMAGDAEAAWSLAPSNVVGLSRSTEREVEKALRSFRADILHVYGSGSVPHALLSGAASPWVADRPLTSTRSFIGRRERAQARAFAGAIADPVADSWFTTRAGAPGSERRRIGSFRQSARTASLRDLVDARIRRFRDDVVWTLFDTPPDPAEMAPLDLWVDLADGDGELDGMVGEAVAFGLPVVASRNAANRCRSGDGRAAALCPSGDPNEIAHAIVTLLFKPERAEPLLAAAAELREHFRPARRRAALLAAYEGVIA